MRRRQSGQAMLEFFVVASFVLIPLLFMIVYLGKVGDVQHRAYESARYALWERTITNKSDNEIKNEVNKRVLYASHEEFDSEKDRLGDNIDAEKIDALYHHINESGNYVDLLVETNDSYAGSSNSNDSPGDAAKARADSLNLFGYDLNDKGLLTSTIEYELLDSKHLNLPIAIKPSAKNVMYVETWRQISNDAVIDAMGDAVVAKRIFGSGPMGDVINLGKDIASLAGFKEFDEFEPGFVRPDVVPCSRVIGGGDNREKACF